jgi:hypothetical protein
MGLKEKIANAKNESKVDALLAQGEKYYGASADTRRKWRKNADRKRSYFASKREAT